jgi:hypothetical protein
VNVWIASIWMSSYCNFLQQEACVLWLTIMDVSVALVGTRHYGGHLSSLSLVFHCMDTTGVLSCPRQESIQSTKRGWYSIKSVGKGGGEASMALMASMASMRTIYLELADISVVC